MHAGEYQKGDYYQLENGKLVDVEDYDKDNDDRIIAKYNKHGKKYN